MDLSDPEEMPQDAPEPETFDVEGQLAWDGDVPVLKFDFDIEQELKSDEFKGITVEVSAEGTIVARGERQVIEQPVLTIVPIDGGGLRLSWEPGDYVIEAATEVTFAEPEIIELDEGQAEYVAKPAETNRNASTACVAGSRALALGQAGASHSLRELCHPS